MDNSIYTLLQLRILVADGDVKAYHFLFDRYWDKVYSAALIILKSPALSEDLAQETFLNVWRSREKLREVQDLDAFLFVVMRNLAFSKLTKLKREEAYRSYFLTRAAAANVNPEDEITYNELAAHIEKGIRQLPPQQRRAFRLSREKGLSHEEIALEMGISKGAVKDYIVRAIAFLRKYLKDYISVWIVLEEILKKS